MGERRQTFIALLGLSMLALFVRDCLCDKPEIVAVLPARGGESLYCAIQTEGVPSAEAIRSMEGGLPSSVDLSLRLLDDRSRLLFKNQISFRIAFDLWDEVFRVDSPVSSRRFDTIVAVERFMAGIDSVPIAPWEALDSEGIYRIEVEMIHYAIAPAQATRIGEWISGDRSGVTGDPGNREVSLGLGSLIRFFYKEGREEKGDAFRFLSDPFIPGELTDETP